MHDERYDDDRGLLARRGRMAARALRWLWKGLRRRPRVILVEVRWRLGDEVMALPIYAELKRRYPDDTVLAWVNHSALLAGNPHADAVDEPPRDADRHIFLREDARAVPRIEHYAKLAKVHVPPEHPQVYGDGRPAPFDLGEGYVAISAGATWPPKRWPFDNWRHVADMLEQAGHTCVVLGADGEYPGAGTDLTGRTTVDDAAQVLRHAALFIGCDSGLMHLALAVGTPSLCLFGPTAQEMLVPGHPLLRALTNERDCQGCWNLTLQMREPGVCPRAIDVCLGTITPERVLSEARQLLNVSA